MVNKLLTSHNNNQMLVKGLKLRKYARKQPWCVKEDTQLAELVKTHGIKRWSVISSIMNNRSAKQCRERWKHQLDPNINNAVWSQDDEWALYLHHCIIGNKWTYLINFFPGRTDNSIKNHWNTQMRKRMAKYKMRLESAIKICRTDDMLFKKSYSPIECRLIEKISKSLLYKKNQGSSKDLKRRGASNGTHENDEPKINHNANNQQQDLTNYGLLHKESMNTIDEVAKQSITTEVNGLKLVNKCTPLLPQHSAMEARWSPIIQNSSLSQFDKYQYQNSITRPSDISSHMRNEHCANLSPILGPKTERNAFVQTAFFNFKLADANSMSQLTDEQIKKNFVKLREIADRIARDCASN